jgi:hypothetical protein
MRQVKRSVLAALLCTAGLGVLTVSASAAQTQALPTPTVRAAGAVIVTQPLATPTVRAVGVVTVTGTPAPRAGGVPLEFVPPLVAVGMGALGMGAVVLRRGRGARQNQAQSQTSDDQA